MLLAIITFVIVCWILFKLASWTGILYRKASKGSSLIPEPSPIAMHYDMHRLSIQERFLKSLPIEIIGPTGLVELMDPADTEYELVRRHLTPPIRKGN